MTTPATDPQPRAPAAARWLGRTLAAMASDCRRAISRVLLILLLLAGGVAAVSWISLHAVIVPRLAEWRPEIEAQATRALGVPVTLGAIEVVRRTVLPRLRLHDVRLLDPQGRVALHLPRVDAVLSAATLWPYERWRWQPVFRDITLDAPVMAVRRHADGHVQVAGVDLSAAAVDGPPQGTPALQWLLAQPSFQIRGGTVQWVDERPPGDGPAAAGLDLTDVALRLTRKGSAHTAELQATPPATWGDRFSLLATLRPPTRTGWPATHDALDPATAHGTLYVDLPRVDVSQLRRHVELPVDVLAGRGLVRAWADLRGGRVVGATADVDLRDVHARLGPSLQPLALTEVRGRLQVEHDAGSTRVSAEHLAFQTTRDEADARSRPLHWPSGSWRLTLTQREGPLPASGAFEADHIDLAVLAQLAERVPLAPALRQTLATLKPAGRVEELALQWQGDWWAPVRYTARGRVNGLNLASGPAGTAVGRPGVSQANVDWTATETGGTAQLSVSDGALSFPGVFDEAEIPLNSLAARVTWSVLAGSRGQPPAVEVRVDNARFANADAQGQLQGRWRTGTGDAAARLPGELDLSGTLSRAQGTRVWRYLPLGVPADVRLYVRDAVTAGRAGDVRFSVRGELAAFPFRPDTSGTRQGRAAGEFRVAARLTDVTFRYLPPSIATPAWPALTALSGELVFDRASMQVRNASARIDGVRWDRIQARIDDLGRDPVVELQAQGSGPLQHALDFVAATPVGGWLNHRLDGASATGSADLTLDLAVPLASARDARVQGSVRLQGNDLRFGASTPVLSRTSGELLYTERGLQVRGARMRVLGGAARVEGGVRPDGGLALQVAGTATMDALREAALAGMLPAALRPVLDRSQGQTSYALGLDLRGSHVDMRLETDLSGVAVDLPAPLGKATADRVPVQASWRRIADAADADDMRLSVDRRLMVHYERDLSGAAPRVRRGVVSLGDVHTDLPRTGVRATVDLPRLDLDAWRRLAPPPAPGAAAPGGYGPDTLTLRAGELLASGRTLRTVVLGASRAGATWRANVDAEQLAGYVEYREGDGSGTVYARLSRLSLPPQETHEVEALLLEPPTSVPALDVVVDDLELRGRRLGRVEVEAVNRWVGGVREWRLARLLIRNPEAQLRAAGNWAPVAGPRAGGASHRVTLDFDLDLGDAGDFLERMGAGRVVRGGKGTLSGQLAWLGTPFAIHYPSLSGAFGVKVGAGRFLKTEPGMARLFGILSLQALPRRLLLDFRDVFLEGFGFDDMAGDVRITDGVAYTNNLRITGVQAAVLMEGSTDIARETQALDIVVVPEINAGTASLAYAVINPAVGLGTFVAQLFLRRPMMQAATREYRVTGTWSDPKVEPRGRPSSSAPAQDDVAARGNAAQQH